MLQRADGVDWETEKRIEGEGRERGRRRRRVHADQHRVGVV